MSHVAVLTSSFVLLWASAAAGEPVASAGVVTEQQAAVSAPHAPALPEPDSREAADESFRFTDRPLTINFVAGLGTPVGELGATFEYNLSDRFAVGGGAGASISGVQVAALARFRPIVLESKNVAQGIDLVGAIATGQYTYPFICNDSGCWKEQAYWAQTGLDYELSWSGFHFATGLGVAVLAAASSVHEFIVDGTPGPVPRVYPTAHLTLGCEM